MIDNEDRGTYSPPTEDHLAYESRRAPAREQAPITLIVSGIFLVILLIAVVLFYNTNMSQRKAIPEIGSEMGDYKDVVDEAKPLTDQELNDVTGLNDQAPAQMAPKVTLPEARNQSSVAVENNTPVIRDVPLGQATKPEISSPIVAQPPKPEARPSAMSSSSVAVAKPATVVATGASVQIGAYGSKEAADVQYNKVASNFGLFLDGTSKRIEKVDVNGNAYYRASFVGFTSKDKARAFCQALKSAGRDCIVK